MGLHNSDITDSDVENNDLITLKEKQKLSIIGKDLPTFQINNVIENDNDKYENINNEEIQNAAKKYIRFDKNLSAEIVEKNFLSQNIVERKHTFTKEEINFFIETINREIEDIKGNENAVTQKDDFLQMIQKKYGTIPEKKTKTSNTKSKNGKSKVNKPNREPIHQPALTEEGQKRYELVLRDLEYLKNNIILNKNDPITSYFTASACPSINTKTKKCNPKLLDMPVVINNTVFKEMEHKLVINNLDPYLNTTGLTNFRRRYYKFFLEILAERTLIFYGLGYKKNFVQDLSVYLNKELQTYYKTTETIPVCQINGLDVPNRYNTLYKVFREHIAIPGKQLKEFEQKVAKKDRQLWGDHALDELSLLEAYYKYTRSNETEKLGNIKVILIIHNVDAEMFRKPSFKKFVAAIAKIPVIALLLTADHVRFPFSFEKNLIDMIKPSYHSLNTLKPFPIEGYINQNDRDRFFSYFDILKSEGAIKRKRNVKVSSSTKGPSVYDEESGLNSIFKSLTKKNLKIFKLLAQTLVERMKDQKGVTKAKIYRIPIREFLSLCQKEFLVSDEVTLRKALSEFVDHSLCSLGDKNRMGIEFLDTGYSETELEYLLNNQLNDLSKYV